MKGTWEDFLAEVGRKREELGLRESEECLYRGHENRDFKLLPTLLRQHSKDAPLLEASLYFEFRARAREMHQQALTGWDILFSMRHHGVATRLLDWTETLGVAVYFALRNARSECKSGEPQPCVWLLNAYALNEMSWKCRDLVAPEYLLLNVADFSDYLVDDNNGQSRRFDWRIPVALYPLQTNARLHAQRRYFTIHGRDERPLDQIAPDILRCVKLPRTAWDGAFKFLSDAGIDEFLMFPDLDGLGRYLHGKYGFDVS